MDMETQIVDALSVDVQNLPEINWQAQLQGLLQKYVVDWEALYRYLVGSGHVRLKSFEDGDPICILGAQPDAVYLITDGHVDLVGASGVRFKGRSAGELVGEQAFLLSSQPGDKEARRTAGMNAHGPVSIISFHGDLLVDMSIEIRALWYEFMAHLVNEKLIEATGERITQMDERIAKSRLLARFCDKVALELVQMATEGGLAQEPEKDAVIWFSDIAGFSGWAKGRDAKETAAAMKMLMGLQVDLIHEFGGSVDKLMGDGLMGFWFIDKIRPEAAGESLRCAKSVIAEFNATISGTDMAGLSLRIGLHCGYVCFGDFGTDERIAVTLIGEAVNLAARYEQLREGEQNPGLGPVRISPELRDRIVDVDEALAAEIAGPQPAKVKTDEFNVFWIEVT